jgi:hypothetical protein
MSFMTRLETDSQTNDCSYFVTELLGTDLHRLLTSRPLEKQFIQYFLYQILVSYFGIYENPGILLFGIL